MQGIVTLTKQTLRFIEENPSEIIFTRKTRVSDGAGGYTTTPTPLDPQVVRVVEQNVAREVERRNVAGEVVRPALAVVAMPYADLSTGDTFPWQGRTAEVVYLTVLPYELIGEVGLT